MRHCATILLAAVVCSSFGCGPSDTITIQGCGATFPAPLYKRWFLEYYHKNPNVRVNYQAIGSGAGIQQFEEGLVTFGATDESLKLDRLKAIAKKLSERDGYDVELIQIPLTAGSVALCYNVPELEGKPPLKLTREAYVGMVLGEITEWDDRLIQAANPDLTLPNRKIVFIRRAESSGTTFVFTTHLHAIDPRWKDKIGPPAKDPLPTGIGGKGTAGVNALIKQTPGAFGYIEEGYAHLTKLPMAALQNKSGNFIMPHAENAKEALQEAKFNEVLGASVPDPKGPKAYPIATFTWVVCRKKYRDPEIGAKLKDVLLSCLSMEPNAGQMLSDDLGYVPLPPDALAKALQKVNEIKAD
jgi:phosphate transport system substrate-binding protein